MKFTVEDEPDLRLPEDSIHRARLDEVKDRFIEWTDSKSGEKKSTTILEWWWEITQPGGGLGAEYKGRKVKGTCDARLSNRAGNRLREWSEALLGRELPVGFQLDVEDLQGLEAEIVIGHRVDKKDPTKIYEQVTDVIPLSTAGEYDQPPF